MLDCTWLPQFWNWIQGVLHRVMIFNDSPFGAKKPHGLQPSMYLHQLQDCLVCRFDNFLLSPQYP